MAEACFKPPIFNDRINANASWKTHKQDLQIFFMAAGLSEESELRKVSILLYSLGSKYGSVFENFGLSAEEKKKFKTVVQKFDDYFQPTKVTKLYMKKFEDRHQQPGESVSQYISELRDIAKYCEFGDTLDRQLCKQISIGVRDKVLRDKLWSEELTLKQIIEKCYHHEQKLESLNVLSGHEQTSADINFIHRGRGQNRGRSQYMSARGSASRGSRGYQHRGRYYNQSRGRFRGSSHQSVAKQGQTFKNCHRCGRAPHTASRRCPALDKHCNYCHYKGHFEKMCRNKNKHVYAVDCDVYDDDMYYDDDCNYVDACNYVDVHCYDDDYVDIDTCMHDFDDVTANFNTLNIYSIGVGENHVYPTDFWNVILPTPYENGKGAVKMKIDTQAECNTLSKRSFDRMAPHGNLTLLPSKTIINAFGNSKIKPVGKTTFTVIHKDRLHDIECEVVDGEVPNLLGGESSKTLGLIRRVHTLDKDKDSDTYVKCKLPPGPDIPDVKRSSIKVPDTKFASSPTAKEETDFLKRIPKVEKVPKCIAKILVEYRDRFPTDRVGKMPGKWTLSLDPEYKEGPVSQAARPIPAAMKEKTKEQLDYLEKQGIIARVPKGTPTPWCSQLHVVHKKDGNSVRICIDPKFLNKALLREYHPINTLEDVLTRIDGSKFFTVLDANMGYYQLQLDENSQLLTSFNTPWGRYMYLRLPMGIKSSPELYQRAMEEIFHGQEHLSNIFDDILLDSVTIQEQCNILRSTLETARQNDVTFRLSKCLFAQPEVDYTGHILTSNGVKVSNEKVRAICEMPEPTSREEVRTLLGMATYLAKYIPHFSDITEPLREVVKKKNEEQYGFYFDEPQKEAFEQLKNALSCAPVLRFYSLKEPLILSCDASQGGLGAVILQGNQPIAYASKTLTQTERAYAQIEKELLAIVFGCRKFHHLLYGRHDITVETDHLPLVKIQHKPLGQVPLRLQKMLLKLQPYDITLIGKSGKDIPIADALSRLSLKDEYHGLVDDMRDCQVLATETYTMTAFSEEKQQELKTATDTDTEFQILREQIIKGWPDTRNKAPPEARPYWDYREELTVYEGILFKGEKVMIPKSMRDGILKLIHSSHQGIVRSKQLARDVLFWSGMNKQIEEMISKCSICQSMRNAQQKEPMISTDVPTLPFELVSTDLFEVEGNHYLATVDHFSGFIEVDELEENTTSEQVIKKLRKLFATHGIPRIVYSDGGPQYSSNEFSKFSQDWSFKHQVFSANYPQANGIAERAVQTAKRLVKKSKQDNSDLQLALLDHRNTPRDTVGSPVQLCMSRRTRTRLPTSTNLLLPQGVNNKQVSTELQKRRAYSKSVYDQHAKSLPILDTERSVRYRQDKKWIPAQLLGTAEKPRSYILQTPSGRMICRNRRHLLQTKEDDIYDNARQTYLNRKRRDDFIAEETRPSDIPMTPPDTPDKPLLRTPQIQHTPHKLDKNQSTCKVVVPEANKKLSTQVTTRSGRVSKPPAKLKAYVT